MTKAPLVPGKWYGLETQPTPGNLDGHGPYPAISTSADALFPMAIPTLIRHRCGSHRCTHLPPVAKLPPVEKFHHNNQLEFMAIPHKVCNNFTFSMAGVAAVRSRSAFSFFSSANSTSTSCRR